MRTASVGGRWPLPPPEPKVVGSNPAWRITLRKGSEANSNHIGRRRFDAARFDVEQLEATAETRARASQVVIEHCDQHCKAQHKLPQRWRRDRLSVTLLIQHGPTAFFA